MTDPKVSKRSVHYRPGRPARECGNCSMFRAPHGCTHVEGRIDRDDVCDDWKAKGRE